METGAPPGAQAAAVALAATCQFVVLAVIMIPYVLAGFGVSGRRQWGRILCLVAAGFSVLFGLLGILGTGFHIYQYNHVPYFVPDEVLQRIMINIVMAGFGTLALFVHAFASFAILTNSKYAKEFR